MTNVYRLTRIFPTTDFNPSQPRKATKCDPSGGTVIVQWAKGAVGRVESASWSQSITKYMTRQQKEQKEED
jgi:hypothetical protein